MGAGTALLRRAGELWGRVRTVSPCVILLIGFAGLVLYAFPGFMSSDSVHQLNEARSRIRGNAHPPIMAAEWTILDNIISGPLLMFVLQGALFLGGTFGVLRHLLTRRVAALTSVGIFWFPPVFATMAVVWKDSQMAAFVIAGVAALLSSSRRARFGGLVLIAAGCAFRYNAFAATVPLVGLLFVWNTNARWWKRYAIAGVAAIGTWAAASITNRLLTVDEAHLTPAYADIVGILAYCDDRTDEDLRHVLRDTPLLVTTNIQAMARRVYSPRNSYHLTKGAEPFFADNPTEVQVAALSRAWRTLLVTEWKAYLAHRTAMFAELLGLSEAGLWAPAYFGFTEFVDHPAFLEYDATATETQVSLHRKLVVIIEETPLFDPWFYAVLALVLLVFFCRDRVSFALLVSGLLYELSYFPTAGTPDCRYSHWMVTCTCLATVVIFVRRWRSRLPQGGA